jgi:predicted permease
VSLATIFLENILPVLLLAGVGLILQRLLRIDPPLSQVIFYAFVPALVLHSCSKPVHRGRNAAMGAFVLVLWRRWRASPGAWRDCSASAGP